MLDQTSSESSSEKDSDEDSNGGSESSSKEDSDEDSNGGFEGIRLRISGSQLYDCAEEAARDIPEYFDCTDSEEEHIYEDE